MAYCGDGLFTVGIKPYAQPAASFAQRNCGGRTLVVHESFRVVAFPLEFGLSAREFQETCSHIHCIRIP
jgi:hypothetical protein